MGGTLHLRVIACHFPHWGHPPLGQQGHTGDTKRSQHPDGHTRRVPGDGPRWTWGRVAEIRTKFGRFSTRLHPYLGDACKAMRTPWLEQSPLHPSCMPPSPIPPTSLSATPPRGSVAFSILGHRYPQAGPWLGCDKARTCPGEDAGTGYPHARHQPGHDTDAGRHSWHSSNAGHPTWHPSDTGTCKERVRQRGGDPHVIPLLLWDDVPGTGRPAPQLPSSPWTPLRHARAHGETPDAHWAGRAACRGLGCE